VGCSLKFRAAAAAVCAVAEVLAAPDGGFAAAAWYVRMHGGKQALEHARQVLEALLQHLLLAVCQLLLLNLLLLLLLPLLLLLLLQG
jgi:hypothetical protein